MEILFGFPASDKRLSIYEKTPRFKENTLNLSYNLPLLCIILKQIIFQK